jgi:hypothetical protein
MGEVSLICNYISRNDDSRTNKTRATETGGRLTRITGDLGGEIGLPGSQTDTRAQIGELMPGAGRVGTSSGLHADAR